MKPPAETVKPEEKKQIDFHKHVEEIYTKSLRVKEEVNMMSKSSNYKSKLLEQNYSEGKLEPSIDPLYWKENFLYPFALSEPPKPKDSGVNEDGTLIDEEAFKFPL